MKTVNNLLTIIFLAFVLVLSTQIMGFETVLAQNYVCSFDADCGSNRFVDQQFCRGNNLYQNYISYTCSSPRTASSYCTATKGPQLIKTCQNQCVDNLWYIGCSLELSKDSTPSSSYSIYPSQKCLGNAVYWFDSYGNIQGLYEQCSASQICSGNRCISNTNINSKNSSNYLLRATKGCINNISYWYDSLGNRQDVYSNCSITSQTCTNGECVGNVPTTPTSKPSLKASLTKHFAIKCFDNSVYWYDSNGTLEDIYANCSDNNSCTIDTCNNNDVKCQNELKCDGSTCSSNSKDYEKYCAKTNSNNTAAVSLNPLAGFLKNWYGWVIIILILLFLFIAIFRRLSSNNQ